MKTGNAGSNFSVGLSSLVFPNLFTGTDGATLNLQGTLVPDSYLQTYAVVGGSSAAGAYSATITDSLSGADRMEFPAMLGQAGQTVMPAPFTAAYPITGAESSVGAYRLTGFDQAGNLAQSTALVLIRDLSGPVMSTAEAPGTAGLMIPVRWAGADEFGGAGLRGYNVEMREDSGAWSRWLTETTQTNADFPGEDGKQYSFRVQGVDRVGNAGAWLETVAVTTNAVTKYYHMAGQRVAMRQGSAVYYLYGDHLGSTSLVTDATGATLTETRYEPYGQPYWQWGATRTDFGFTGQRLDGFGLMDYNARYYSSTLGRFVSPDSIIPQPGSPLAWDRYGYTYNNPINYNDPSGHCPWCVVVGAVAGAVVSYGMQVVNNYQNGLSGSEAWVTNISGEKIAAGALAGATIGLGVGIVSVFVGGGAVAAAGAAGAGGAASSTVTAVLNATGEPSDEIAVTTQAFGNLSQAANYGVQPYTQLKDTIVNTGLTGHHIIEQRLAPALGQISSQVRNWPSVALTHQEHQVITNAWRNAIGYINSNNPINTATATIDDIWTAAQNIYARYPALLEAAKNTLFGLE